MVCTVCGGTGICPACGGTGNSICEDTDAMNPEASEGAGDEICPACDGSGKCSQCDGTGYEVGT